MSKTSLTLEIDSRLLRKIKVLGVREGISINVLITTLLEKWLKKKQDYEPAKGRALARLREGYISESSLFLVTNYTIGSEFLQSH